MVIDTTLVENVVGVTVEYVLSVVGVWLSGAAVLLPEVLVGEPYRENEARVGDEVVFVVEVVVASVGAAVSEVEELLELSDG